MWTHQTTGYIRSHPANTTRHRQIKKFNMMKIYVVIFKQWHKNNHQLHYRDEKWNFTCNSISMALILAVTAAAATAAAVGIGAAAGCINCGMFGGVTACRVNKRCPQIRWTIIKCSQESGFYLQLTLFILSYTKNGSLQSLILHCQQRPASTFCIWNILDQYSTLQLRNWMLAKQNFESSK